MSASVSLSEQLRMWLLAPVATDLDGITSRLDALGVRMSALDDALADFATEASAGFNDLHTTVDALRQAVESGNTAAIADAASRVVAAKNALHDQFASFTQNDDVPVDPQPTPDPIPEPTPVDPGTGDGTTPTDPTDPAAGGGTDTPVDPGAGTGDGGVPAI